MTEETANKTKTRINGRAGLLGLIRHSPLLRCALSAVALCWGCTDDDSDVIAEIGDRQITLTQLLEFVEQTPERLRSDKPGVEAMRDHLQSLIDMRLMELEALDQLLDDDPGFVKEYDQVRRKRLVSDFLKQHFERNDSLGKQDLKERYAKSKWSRQLQLAHIELSNNDEAESALAKIRAGRSFEEVSAEVSQDAATADKGGVIKKFVGREHIEDIGLPLEVAAELFDLAVGDVSRVYALGAGYEIFKIVQEQAAPDWYSDVFAKTEQKDQFLRAKKQLVRDLAEKHHFRIDQNGLAFVISKAAQPGANFLRIPEGEQEIVLCRFDGGHLTLQDFSNAYRQVWFYREVRFDSSGIAAFVNRYMLEDTIIAHEAEIQGVDDEEPMATWLSEKRESMLVHVLKKKEVDARVDTNETDVRRFYETHINRFMMPEEACVIEVLVETEEEANDILARAQKGESLRDLADAHSIRQGMEKHGGQFCLHPYERPFYGPMLDIALKADLGFGGGLYGPVQVRHGFAVFTVLERIDARPQTFEEARKKAAWWLRKSQENRFFEELMGKLRAKYKSRVIVHEDRLAPLS